MEIKHDYESYIITIRRQNLGGQSALVIDSPTPVTLTSPKVEVKQIVPEPKVALLTKPEDKLTVSTSGKNITSPLPGVIIEINVKVGDKVSEGQELAILEAMKMENSIEATCNGVVSKIHVSKGDSILEGVAIITIEG